MNKQARLELDGAEDPILFYNAEDEWGVFSNFSEHGIWLPHPFTGETVWYRTGEHRFQAMKATTEEGHEHVRLQPNAYKAKRAGGPKGSIMLREGWVSDYGNLPWYVMFETVLAKYVQVVDAQEALSLTGSRHIYEDSTTDDIWGWRFRNDYRGKNLLGRCWMQVRDLMLG
jgi:ribA/ribD-fused uncharacterized protein